MMMDADADKRPPAGWAQAMPGESESGPGCRAKVMRRRLQWSEEGLGWTQMDSDEDSDATRMDSDGLGWTRMGPGMTRPRTRTRTRQKQNADNRWRQLDWQRSG